MPSRSGPTFQEIKAVLSVPEEGLPKRATPSEAMVELLTARTGFLSRATPATWARLVAAARRVHAEVRGRPPHTIP